jgi:hypothetical protein
MSACVILKIFKKEMRHGRQPFSVDLQLQLPGSFLIHAAVFQNLVAFMELKCHNWLQKDNVTNQREHVVHLLANEQSRLGKLPGNEPVCILCTLIFYVVQYFFWG